MTSLHFAKIIVRLLVRDISIALLNVNINLNLINLMPKITQDSEKPEPNRALLVCTKEDSDRFIFPVHRDRG
jgi:hypothetical protein